MAFVLTIMSLRVSCKCGKAIDTKVKVGRRSCPHIRQGGTYGSGGRAPHNLKSAINMWEIWTRFGYVVNSVNWWTNISKWQQLVAYSRQSTAHTLSHYSRQSNPHTLSHYSRQSTPHTLSHYSRQSTPHTVSHYSRQSTPHTRSSVDTHLPVYQKRLSLCPRFPPSLDDSDVWSASL
jgi:hypothetical protein